MKRIILAFTFLALISCTDSGPSVEKSGDKDLDLTASFLLHLVEEVKTKQRLNTPSEIADYITSVEGKAALIPPSEEYEPDAAKYYKGPRPAENVNYYPEFREDSPIEKQIVLTGDDERKVIIAEGYKSLEDEDPLFIWEWPLPK